jgi:hypothetical protein
MNANQKIMKDLLIAFHAGTMSLDELEQWVFHMAAPSHVEAGFTVEDAKRDISERFDMIRASQPANENPALSLVSSASFIMYFEDPEEE